MADSRSYQHEIARMREDAHDLLQALYAEQFPDDDAVGGLRARIEQSATEVIRAADDPVTLGIVGEFSVGKSLLLGTLLGRPDLLPVEDRATTGNVTALHLRPGNPGERTRFDGDPEICYLTAEELAKCVRTIMDHLVHHYTGVLHRDLPELDGYDPVTQGWDRLVAVCRRLWGPETSGNPIILDTARELLRIRAAHLSGGGLLGEVVAISETRVRQAAIELGTDGGGLASYPDFPVRTITKSAVKGDDSALRISFPLIRRVAYKVTVDAGLWPLDSLRGSDDEVVLLDFPGLTASRSARRDEYLSSTELRDVHTIVTVFSMQKPDTKTPLEFRSMLQQHGRERAELDQSILAVGNRFDMIDVPAPLATGQPTAEALLDHAGLVGRFADTARRLVGRQDQAAAGQWDHRDSADSQITIVSAVAGISHYGYPVSFPAQEQERLDAALREVPASMASWGDVGQRLAAGQPGSRWARVLTDFGKDGGISALRQLIEDHAARNGLVNKFKVVERADRRLREQLPQLERLLAPEHAGADETERAQELLAQVFDDFRRLYGEIDAAAREFGDPTRVTLADGAPLISGVRNRAVTEVFTWPYWQQFLQRAEHGYVTKGTRRARVRFRGTADQDETTRTFLDQYRDTLQRTAKWGRVQLAESVRAWADRHNGKGADLRDRLADEDVRRYLDMGLSRLRAVKDADYEDALQALADLNVLLEIDGDDEPGILASARDMADADGNPPMGHDESTASYPLFIGADGAGSAAMPWHPDVPERPGEADQLLVRHQIYVFRLRRQLAMGAADAVTRQLSGEIDQIYQYLRAVLGEISSLIPGSMQLGQMFPESSGAPGQADADSEPPEPSEPPPPPVSPVRDLLREWARRQHGA